MFPLEVATNSGLTSVSKQLPGVSTRRRARFGSNKLKRGDCTRGAWNGATYKSIVDLNQETTLQCHQMLGNHLLGSRWKSSTWEIVRCHLWWTRWYNRSWRWYMISESFLGAQRIWSFQRHCAQGELKNWRSADASNLSPRHVWQWGSYVFGMETHANYLKAPT